MSTSLLPEDSAVLIQVRDGVSPYEGMAGMRRFFVLHSLRRLRDAGLIEGAIFQSNRDALTITDAGRKALE